MVIAQFVPAFAWIVAVAGGQVTVGASSSFTVNVMTHEAVFAGIAASVTVTVTGIIFPSETPLWAPAGILCVIGVGARLQLSAASVTSATRSGIFTAQLTSPVVFSVKFAGVGQVKVGASLSFTVITTWQVALFAGVASSDTV
jgi:hypothetical protein